jgi:hypothetical protein
MEIANARAHKIISDGFVVLMNRITLKELFFVGMNFSGLHKNYNFVDFVFVPKISFTGFQIFKKASMHWTNEP